MDPKIIEAVRKRSKGLCEVCGSNYLLQHHHIVGGRGKRKQCENEHSIILLCWNCHHGSKWGVHGKNGKDLNLYLKRKLQEKYFDMRYTESEVREKMGGKLY